MECSLCFFFCVLPLPTICSVSLSLSLSLACLLSTEISIQVDNIFARVVISDSVIRSLALSVFLSFFHSFFSLISSQMRWPFVEHNDRER